MPNIVETTFSSKDTGLVDTIEKISNKFPEIVRGTQAASAGVDLLELKLRRLSAIAANHNIEISKTDYSALRTKGIAAIDATIDKIQKATNAQRILTAETLNTAAANTKVDAAVARIREQQARTQVIGDESSLAVRTPQFAAPNVAAANAIENATRKIDAATAAQKRFHGATLVGSQLLRQFGVEGTRAIEVLINQFSTMGVTLKDLFKSPTIGYTFLLAGVVAAGEAINHVFSQIRENAEASLKRAEDFARVSRLGIRGDSTQTANELQDLYKIKAEVQKFTSAGLFAEVPQLLRDKGLGALTPEQLNIRIEQAKRRNAALGLDTRSEEEIKAAEKLNEAEKQRVETGKDLFKSKIEQYNQEDKLRKIEQQAIANVSQLRAALADNPYEKFYIEAKSKQEQFLEQFRSASPLIKQQGVDLIEQLRQVNVFRENLSRGFQISDTITERAKLDAGLGGENLRENADRVQAEKQKILDEISSRRGAGDLTGAQQYELLARLEKLNTSSPLQRITSEAIDRQIAIAEKALTASQSPEQKRLALEAGINATRDTGNLTSSQIDARAKFLDQILAIQQDVLSQQRQREDSRRATDEKLANSADRLAKAIDTFEQSAGILSSATNQIKDGVNLNIKSDEGLSVDLGSVNGTTPLQSGTSLSNNF